MGKIDSEKLMFYQYLNGDITSKELEQWIYNTPSLEVIFTAGHYHDLISFNFKSSNTTTYIKSLVKKFFCINEYELWRTITLLTNIKDRVKKILGKEIYGNNTNFFTLTPDMFDTDGFFIGILKKNNNNSSIIT